jgi:hypothetical protein
VFAKGADIYPAMAVDQIDISASGADGAVAARGNGVSSRSWVPPRTVATFLPFTSASDLAPRSGRPRMRAAPKFGLKIDEKVFAKGADIYPAMAVDQIDISASGAGRWRPSCPSRRRATWRRGRAGRGCARRHWRSRPLLLLAELDKHGLTWSDRPGKDVQLIYFNNYADLK